MYTLFCYIITSISIFLLGGLPSATISSLRLKFGGSLAMYTLYVILLISESESESTTIAFSKFWLIVLCFF